MARNIFSRQQYKLIHERGFSPEDARRIAYKSQVKNWNLIPWTYQLTEKWKEWSNLFSEKREYIRRHWGKMI